MNLAHYDSFYDSLLITRELVDKMHLLNTVNLPPVPNQINSCVISASFKYYSEVLKVKKFFEANGIFVAAPDSSVITIEESFPVLSSDLALRDRFNIDYHRLQGKDLTDRQLHALLEWRFLESIRSVGWLYIVDPVRDSIVGRGYGGDMVGAEIGAARVLQKPIYIQRPLDLDLDYAEGTVIPHYWAALIELKSYSPEQMVSMVKGGGLDVRDYQWCEGFQWSWPSWYMRK